MLIYFHTNLWMCASVMLRREKIRNCWEVASTCPSAEGQKGPILPNATAYASPSGVAARCLALAREELGALRRRAGLPQSSLRGTIHTASDITGRVEQPAGLRGQMDSNGDGSAKPGNLLPHLPQRPPCPPRSPPATSAGSGLRASGPGRIWLSGIHPAR